MQSENAIYLVTTYSVPDQGECPSKLCHAPSGVSGLRTAPVYRLSIAAAIP